MLLNIDYFLRFLDFYSSMARIEEISLKLTGCGLFVAVYSLNIIMEPVQQLAMMDKIIRELDDLKNSQTSVLKKIAQVEADNINLNAEVLNEDLPGIHEEVDAAVQKVDALLEKFKEYRDEYEKDHPVPTVEA